MKPISKRFVANLPILERRGSFGAANGAELQVRRSLTPDLEISLCARTHLFTTRVKGSRGERQDI